MVLSFSEAKSGKRPLKTGVSCSINCCTKYSDCSLKNPTTSFSSCSSNLSRMASTSVKFARRVYFAAFDGILVHRHPLVGSHIGKVDQAHKVTACLAILLILYRHAINQQLMESAIGSQQHRRIQIQHLLQGVFPRYG
jgi:hypothetical protein